MGRNDKAHSSSNHNSIRLLHTHTRLVLKGHWKCAAYHSIYVSCKSGAINRMKMWFCERFYHWICSGNLSLSRFICRPWVASTSAFIYRFTLAAILMFCCIDVRTQGDDARGLHNTIRTIFLQCQSLFSDWNLRQVFMFICTLLWNLVHLRKLMKFFFHPCRRDVVVSSGVFSILQNAAPVSVKRFWIFWLIKFVIRKIVVDGHEKIFGTNIFSRPLTSIHSHTWPFFDAPYKVI